MLVTDISKMHTSEIKAQRRVLRNELLQTDQNLWYSFRGLLQSELKQVAV